MFFLVPLGIEGPPLRRIPWASIVLVALILLGFGWTPPWEGGRWALVPERGLGQVGLWTHLFAQVGWLRLLSSLLFFYLAGLLLEDAWGRVLFPAFYVGSGVLTGVGYVLADPRSSVAMAGGSGAIAACMGAFAIRFIGVRVRLGYVVLGRLRVMRGELRVPAWLFALGWLGLEAVAFLAGGAWSGGRAALEAHLGGFLFGAAFALALRVSGIEQRVLEPALERATGGCAPGGSAGAGRSTR